jgi:murein DD-endopeptidase MepM/ murein hydrolase activator NlpD
MTNLPVTGIFQITCEYHRKGNAWIAGHHTGVDIVADNRIIYSTCDGIVERVAHNNKDYGNFVVVRDKNGRHHYFCHLESIRVSEGEPVGRLSKIGIMGSTGKSTGIHLHYEIRNESNRYNDNQDPTEYMGIPNVVGTYNSADYQLSQPEPAPAPQPAPEPELKTLARNTNLRDTPTTHSSKATLYLANTTLYVLEPSVANNDGYVWDKVRIRVNGKEGYMINKNYK